MERINIIFEDDYNDVDIIAIPRELSAIIIKIAYEHSFWVADKAPKDDSDYWENINGELSPILETVGFVKWLNNYYCKGKRRAIILKQHTKFVSDFRSIEW